jgi:hypothetical protein
MVIVMATRADLRDESVMADEVFALSPISARAVQPSEADYDAIREAFMETSRGRWFLGEYAKRNRNADTSMVLDAVARIEETLAAHRQAPPADGRLSEALATIRSAVDQATEDATAAFDRTVLDASLAPILKGTRIIKEISWRWREIGADGRICDLIDSQLEAIEAGCGRIVERDPRAALIAAFEEIKASIAAFADIEREDTAPPAEEGTTTTASPPASERTAQPSKAYDDVIIADIVTQPIQPEAPAPEALVAVGTEAPMAEQAQVSEEALAEEALAEQALAGEAVVEDDVVAEPISTMDMPADEPIAAVEPVELAADAAHNQPATQAASQADALAQADAHDEAVLERVAAEMSAPDPIDIDDFSSSIDDDIIVTMRSADVVSTERMPEPVAAPVRPPIVQPFPQVVAPVAFQPPPAARRDVPRDVSPEPAIEPSLGSTIIANGLLQPAKTPANDPLAPIRRMSQAEKIAFFS